VDKIPHFSNIHFALLAQPALAQLPINFLADNQLLRKSTEVADELFAQPNYRLIIPADAGIKVSKLYASFAQSLRSCAVAFSVWGGNGLPVAVSIGEDVVYATSIKEARL